MPEPIERTPFGASKGRSFLEVASHLSSLVKKRIDEKYYHDPIPPTPTNETWEVIFASLGLNQTTITKFWRLFCQINNCSGTMQIEHFLEHFDLEWTHWTERCFKYFAITSGGEVDFLAFVVGVVTICTLKVDTLSNFAFDMYDLDSDGELSLPEIERMVYELFGVGGGKQCLKEAIDFAKARGGVLSLDAFISFTGNHQLLLFPMFQIQRKIQRKALGLRFWVKMERRSKDICNDLNRNDFNARQVQILLRSYKIDDVLAILGQDYYPSRRSSTDYKNNSNGDQVPRIEADAKLDGIQQKSPIESVRPNTTKRQRWARVKESILNQELWQMTKVESKIFPVRGKV